MSHDLEQYRTQTDVDLQLGGPLQPGSQYTQINYYGTPATHSPVSAPTPSRFPPVSLLLLAGGVLALGVFWWSAPQQQLARVQNELVQAQSQLAASQAENQRIKLCVEGDGNGRR